MVGSFFAFNGIVGELLPDQRAEFVLGVNIGLRNGIVALIGFVLGRDTGAEQRECDLAGGGG